MGGLLGARVQFPGETVVCGEVVMQEERWRWRPTINSDGKFTNASLIVTIAPNERFPNSPSTRGGNLKDSGGP